MYLILFLILFFIFIVSYNFIFHKTIEGMDDGYVEYDTNNPNNALILSQQNAGNIAYLKQRVDKVDQIDKQVNDLSKRTTVLEKQMVDIAVANKEMAQSLPGVGKPIEPT